MFEANSERNDRPEELGTGEHHGYAAEGSTHDGLTAQDDGESDIDDDLFAELNSLVRQSEAAAAENGSTEGTTRRAVALLERPIEEDSVKDPREGQGTIYISEAARRRQLDSEQEVPVRRQPGAGAPPLPPRPPVDRGGGSNPGEPGGEGDDSSGDQPFSWLTPSDRPRPVEPTPASLEFMPETTMLRRMELLTRIGALVNFREGAEAGRQVAQAERQEAAARAAAEAHIPKHAADPDDTGRAAMEAPTQMVEIVIGRPPLDLALPEAVAPDEVAAPADTPVETPPPEPMTELQIRQQRASLGPDYYSGPPDDILERIRAGLRRDDVGRGQADPTIKDRAKGIEVEEVTDEEIAAAGGDIMAARAEKIARMQEEQRQKPEE